MGPQLGGLAAADVEDLHLLVLDAPALALGPERAEGDHMLVVAAHIVQLDAALVVAAERAPAGEMPPDALGENVPLSAAMSLRRQLQATLSRGMTPDASD
jgi:hypothetical protein